MSEKPRKIMCSLCFPMFSYVFSRRMIVDWSQTGSALEHDRDPIIKLGAHWDADAGVGIGSKGGCKNWIKKAID